MHGNMDSHDGFQEILTDLEKTARRHEFLTEFANNMVAVGTAMVISGRVILRVQRRVLAKR